MATSQAKRFAPKLKIKTGDTVVVISGANKGTKGEVLKVFPQDNKAIVSGVKVAKRHLKPTAEQAGQIVEKEMPIHISNIKLVVNGAATKVGRRVENGKIVRYAKSTGETI
jgi:large subunit ribosomal protein L24